MMIPPARRLRLLSATLAAALCFAACAPARVAAEPRVIRGDLPPVRIIRGNQAPPPTPAVAPLDLTAPAPAGVDSAARAAIGRMIDAFGGSAVLSAWVGRGERRGHQAILAPARIESRFVERRDGSRRRVDLAVAGAGISFVTGPEGSWQSYMGLVSDLPEREREDLRVEEAHDERLLLEAWRGLLPARLDPGAAAAGEIAVAVWGPRGSATRFRADAATGRLGAVEFHDLDPLGEGTAFQVRTFGDWRAIGPDHAPLRAPREGAVPLAARDRVGDLVVVEASLDTLDLGRAFDDSVFARPGASALQAGPSRRTILPLVRRGDHHFADVRIGDGPPRRFLVDTGAGLTALSLPLARELGLEAGESLEIVGLGGGTPAQAITLPPLTVGGFTLRGVQALALDLGELRAGLGGELDGILGFSALSRYSVTFDFERDQLELAENAPPRVPGAGGTRIPFAMVGGQVIVPVRVDGGNEASFLVDSGAWRTFLPPEVGAALDVPADRRLPGIPSSGADGRPIEAEAMRVRSLSIGDVEVRRPIVLVPARADSGGSEAWSLVTRARGVLGADILRRFRVTIDFPRQEMTLEPIVARAGAGDAGDESFSGPGVVLASGAAAATVRRVLAGSPAARAGVRAGDRVTAIDGAPTAGVRGEILRQRLAGAPGSTVRLTVHATGSVRDERTIALERALLL